MSIPRKSKNKGSNIIGHDGSDWNYLHVDSSGKLTVQGTVTSSISGAVSVSNMIAAVETGLAKDATLTAGTQKAQVVGADAATCATVEARKQTPTGNALNVQIGPGDVISNIPVTIDYPHHQIHEGETHTYCNLQTGGLNSGSNFDVRISVGALTATTRTPHMIFEVIATGETEIYLHKGVTWTSGGTAVAAGSAATAMVNRNHNSTNAPGTALYVTGGTALTVNNTGTIVYIWYLPPSGKVQTGGGDRSTNEIDLAPSTEYMLRITSRTAGLKFLLRLDWYEDLGV